MLSLETDQFVLVLDEHLENIYQIDVASGTTFQLLPSFSASRPLALAYDRKDHVVFWTEYNSVRKCAINGSRPETVYHEQDNGKGTFTTLLYDSVLFLNVKVVKRIAVKLISLRNN